MGSNKNGTPQYRNLIAPEIIWAAVSGDRKALDTIYQNYRGYSVKIADSIARKRYRKGYYVQMEDILQEAWEWILTEDIKKFRGK